MRMNNVVTVEEEISINDSPAGYISHNLSYRIKSKDEIHAFLSRLYKNHALLSISIGNSDIIFGSVILEVNREKEYLVLDELYPRNQIRTPLLHQKLSIETQLEGILLQFSGTVDAASEQDGAEYYKIRIPKYVYHHQRRDNYRVPISISKPLRADLATENEVLIHAELRDLSLSGFCARLSLPSSEKLAIGDEIPTCIIQIPDGKKIVGSLEIMRIEETRPLRNTRIGARFSSLNNSDRQELSRVIAKLERENIKTLKRQSDQ
ncbi:MAG: flagellar brake protein [Gammaproteobacteria bacterium]